jgi:hypothetical protein
MIYKLAVIKKQSMKKIKRKHVSAAKLISEIPEDILNEIGENNKIDYQVKHLTGSLMFKLILYALFKNSKISSRIMENYYNSNDFSTLTDKGKHQTRHSSLADRLKSIKCKYFEDIFSYYSNELQIKHLNKNNGIPQIERFDSTMVAISSSLINWGMNVGMKAKKRESKVQLKFTIGLRGMFPADVKLFHEQRYVSEDLAMAEVIKESIFSKDSISVFDRGIQDRKTYSEFSLQNKRFVTRAKTNIKHEIVRVHKIVKGRRVDNLILENDLIVKLKKSGGKTVESEFRLIIAKDAESGKSFLFLTNIFDMSAKIIIQIYGYRWDIEVFFRFLKQELNFDNITPYNENGIKVMLYVTMIASMMILLYKKVNKIEGYRIAKLMFIADIEKEITGEIVKMCGGDFKRYKQLYLN